MVSSWSEGRAGGWWEEWGGQAAAVGFEVLVDVGNLCVEEIGE